MNDSTTNPPAEQCVHCGKTFPFTTEHFVPKFNDKTNPSRRCRECKRASDRDYYSRHKQKIAEYKHEYAKVNHDKENARKRKWEADNKDHVRELKARGREKNRVHLREYHREWSSRNKDKVSGYGHRRYWRDVEVTRAKMREYNFKNQEKTRERGRRTARRQAEKGNVKVNMHRRRARKLGLQDTFTHEEWLQCLSYFGNCCAVCGRPQGLWHTLAADHWIPLASKICPGTTSLNIIPLCHGINGCNNSKGSKSPNDWLVTQFGNRKAKQILSRIEAYFQWVKTKSVSQP